jgi:hypothetical protein
MHNQDIHCTESQVVGNRQVLGLTHDNGVRGGGALRKVMQTEADSFFTAAAAEGHLLFVADRYARLVQVDGGGRGDDDNDGGGRGDDDDDGGGRGDDDDGVE